MNSELNGYVSATVEESPALLKWCARYALPRTVISVLHASST